MIDAAAVSPREGLGVLHLFLKTGPLTDAAEIRAAVKVARGSEAQVIPVAMLGHKADLAIMALAADWRELRALQTALVAAGLDLVDSYVSLTEISEYAQGVPEEMRRNRLYPQLPPEDKPAWCFYPMSKRRVGDDQNWFTLPFHKRKELMYEHGASGRKFSGRVLQVISGSTGIDDYEWGVTLFCQHPDDLKAVVYTMRFDEASSVYADFGPFYSGICSDLDDVLDQLGLE